MGASTQTDAEVESLVLDAADSLFYIRGIADVSMSEIRDAAKVSMRRLYRFAPSKADLVSRWLRYRHAAWTTGFAQRIDDHVAAGATPVDAIFDALADWMTDTNFRGCGFINTHAESGELTPEHERIIRDHKTGLAHYLDEVAGNGRALAVIVDGAIVQASIFSNTDPVRHAHLAAQAITSKEQR